MNLLFAEGSIGSPIGLKWSDVWLFTRDNWPLLLSVVLGFLAVYWLLPTVRKSWALPGALAGTLAIILAGVFLIHREFATVEGLLFYAFSGIAVLGGGLMLAQHNPVRAALSFTLVVLSSCGLFLLLAAPFLMAATIIIYAGAIIITFLFVVMLAQQAGLAGADRRSREPFLASLAGFVLLVGLLIVVHRTYEIPTLEKKLRQVVNAVSDEEVIRILGDPKKAKKGNMELEWTEELKSLFPDRHTEINNLNVSWARTPIDKSQFDVLKKQCSDLLADAPKARMAKVSLQPASQLPLSPYSLVPANAPLPSEVKERLPAANVAAIGKSLFTDYLVAVNMAGVLLLVATIGAIGIARRKDGEQTKDGGRKILTG